ncbi:multicomponent Na+:H+ antiporter subunit F [Kineosphaera limosa]|uniref:Na(+)/H(+) antiporter subunit F n=1 Tax=Kineosphaera limosa NBRC 100340 TaxID=1184609 RepID=K6WM10_9MICO|nr:monovalent cation/H+ antiporter complex subunit F [Kineosphaera limosa]NYD98864.1 multicomponent Na+:H+ antiporter subunit F [Kineosphaera limosa]GAB94811.1 Na(+)/H(+) antiporter subunit F [Kineosphaera limosa NBRC 100340]
MPETLETTLFGAIALCLGLSALLAIVRIIRGPSVLDRTVATEVLVSTIVCALGALAALTRSSTTLPIVISLSLVGFLGSVAVARFMPQPHDPADLPGDGGSTAVLPVTRPRRRSARKGEQGGPS